MTRVPTILAAVAALAVTAAPVASAGPSKEKAAPPGVESFSIDIGTSEQLKVNATALHEATRKGSERTSKQGAVLSHGHADGGANADILTDTINASGGWDPILRAAEARGAHAIENLDVKYT